MRLLLIEDDTQIGQSLVYALQDAGCSVDWVRTGDLARSAIADGSYTAMLLDLGLPDADGIDILKWARTKHNETPILIITARDDVDTQIMGLDVGADDYLVTPFESRELLARVRAGVRRTSGFSSATVGHGRVTLDINLRKLTCDGHSDTLSAREYALMLALLERPGAFMSRAQLEERVYGWGEEVESNAIDAIIYGIRRRFGSTVVRNVRGLGWAIPAQ
jgi:two-component system OmpR family response regulator